MKGENGGPIGRQIGQNVRRVRKFRWFAGCQFDQATTTSELAAFLSCAGAQTCIHPDGPRPGIYNEQNKMSGSYRASPHFPPVRPAKMVGMDERQPPESPKQPNPGDAPPGDFDDWLGGKIAKIDRWLQPETPFSDAEREVLERVRSRFKKLKQLIRSL
jgi:hypothetical protein